MSHVGAPFLYAYVPYMALGLALSSTGNRNDANVIGWRRELTVDVVRRETSVVRHIGATIATSTAPRVSLDVPDCTRWATGLYCSLPVRGGREI
jgi:hypothetical protein